MMKILIPEINFQVNKMMIGMIEGEKEEVVTVRIIIPIKSQDLKMTELRILNHVIRKINLNKEDKKVVCLLYINLDKKRRFMILNIG